MDTKYCGGCYRSLDQSEFSKNPSKKDGLNNRCKKCHTEYQAGWYRRNKERHLASTRERLNRVILENKRRIFQYLKEHPCIDCGENDPIVLDFDHVRGKKKKTVSILINSGFGWDVILEEIDKCEVRCANCHRRVTAKRGNWFSLTL